MRRFAALLAVALAACTPSAISETEVELTEFGIATAPRLTEGTQSLHVVNRGEFGHTLVVSTSDGTVVTSTDVLGSGTDAVVELDLEPGKYLFTCRIVVETPDGEIVDHYQRGMAANVEVVGP